MRNEPQSIQEFHRATWGPSRASRGEVGAKKPLCYSGSWNLPLLLDPFRVNLLQASCHRDRARPAALPKQTPRKVGEVGKVLAVPPPLGFWGPPYLSPTSPT